MLGLFDGFAHFVLKILSHSEIMSFLLSPKMQGKGVAGNEKRRRLKGEGILVRTNTNMFFVAVVQRSVLFSISLAHTHTYTQNTHTHTHPHTQIYRHTHTHTRTRHTHAHTHRHEQTLEPPSSWASLFVAVVGDPVRAPQMSQP